MCHVYSVQRDGVGMGGGGYLDRPSRSVPDAMMKLAYDKFAVDTDYRIIFDKKQEN